MRFDPQSNFVPESQAERMLRPRRAWGRLILRGFINLLVLVLCAAVPVAGYWVWKDYRSMAPGELQAVDARPAVIAPEDGSPGAGAASDLQDAIGGVADSGGRRSRMTPSQAAYARGKSYLDEGEHERAARQFRDAIRINPDFAQAHYGLALTYVLANDHTSAREEQAILQDLDENLARLLENLIH